MATITKECKVCGKDARQHCSRCAEGLDVNGKQLPTSYCSRACQVADWPNHKRTDCRYANARKQLYRGGQLLQDVFYRFRELTFNYNIKKLEFGKDEKMHITMSDRVSCYPKHAPPDQTQVSGRNRHALLSWRNSNTAVAYMNSLIKRVLEGDYHIPSTQLSIAVDQNKRTGIVASDTAPTETAFAVKDFHVHLKIIHHAEDGTKYQGNYEHVVIRTKLIDGEEYVIDIAGAQFGQFAAVLPMNAYRDHVAQELASKPLGTWWQFWTKCASRKPDAVLPEDYAVFAVMIIQSAAKSVNAGLQVWDEGAVMTVTEILNAKQVIYCAGTFCLINATADSAATFVSGLESDALMRVLLPMARPVIWVPLKTAEINAGFRTCTDVEHISVSSKGVSIIRQQMDKFKELKDTGKAK